MSSRYDTGPHLDRRPPIRTRHPLRVGILADTVELPGGIGRYVREVLSALGRRADVRVAALTVAEGTSSVSRLTAEALDAMIVAPRSDQISLALWDRYRSGRAFERAGAEVIIGTKHLLPRTHLPTLLVVHDVLTITRARENALAKRVLLPHQFRHSLADASELLAESRATRTRLGDLDHRWRDKCSVVPLGMGTELMSLDPEASSAVDGRRFALVVGDLSPRKNVGLLTRLWKAGPPDDLTLVVVGPDSGQESPVRTDLLELERTGRVVWIRGAGDAVLRWCYERCAVMAFPTFEEGFGLPLLEAMTFGAPIVASTDLALLEISDGDPRVRHVDAQDDAGWRRAIVEASKTRRVPGPPVLPTNAITWDEHTDRLIERARALARGVPSPVGSTGG